MRFEIEFPLSRGLISARQLRKLDIELAKDLLLGRSQESSRDALHVAVMRRHDIKIIMSFDRGLDAYPGIQRIGT